MRLFMYVKINFQLRINFKNYKHNDVLKTVLRFGSEKNCF